MNKLFLVAFLFIQVLNVSCKDDDNDDAASKRICTECTATINGTTTLPAQYCGAEGDVKNFESSYISQNKNVGATAKCNRK